MDIESIKKIIKSPAGRELKKFIKREADKIRDIHNLKNLDNDTELAIEVKAHKKASVILQKIFSQIGIWEEEQGRTEEDKFKDSYI